ncbi:MAG: VWA domain-containing protein [Candidatus Eisenbacteria bacterium]|uniref:VWA domain-containing protein n=1 Tax=Eiseniibacteriota bacterium TaxID=2212470 RepID=A0A956SFQ2_UNCEI|nr:VWA domain-containing protein [Candidatus Eisenbacteria bacterium]
MSFAYPQLLWLLILPPLLFAWRVYRRRRMNAPVAFSSVDAIPARRTWRTIGAAALPWLRFFALCLLIVALARPRTGENEVEVTSEGIDIVLAIDISSSMKAEDFQPKNRLHVAKEEAKKFVAGRKTDRIGLVVFASNSFTQCPLTTDYAVIDRLIDEIDFGDIQDGTAIGMAIANGVNRLKDVEAKSRVLIVLTDGRNNAGTIDPLTAAELAHSLGVRVYTIGVGDRDEAPFPVEDPVFGKHYVSMPAQVDEETLTQIADITDGKYFRATDAESLAGIYSRIDALEKTVVETREWVNYSDVGTRFLLPALGLLLLELITGLAFLRRLP